MSRTRKRKPRDFYKGTKTYHVCPRHGYCWWCDRDRQHSELKAEANAEQDLMNALEAWDDLWSL